MSWLTPSEDESKQALEYRKNASEDPDQKDFYRLLRVLALALRIEPLLLRNARVYFAPGSDTEWETEIWFSALIRTRTVKSVVMREGIARKLVEDLETEPEEYQKALAFVEQHTRHWSEADRLEQKLRLAAVNHDQNALKDGFQQMLKTIDQTTDDHERREWARWIKGALPGLAEDSGQIPETGWLQQYVAAALGSSGQALQRDSKSESMPAWLAQALPKSGGHSLYLRLRPGVLECLNEKDELPDHEIKISLPLPTPLLLSENDRNSRWEGFWPGRRIRIAKELKALTLQTLTGERFRFTVKQDEEETGQPTGPDDTIVLAFLPQDQNAAWQIARFLDNLGIKIKLVEDDPEKPAEFSDREVAEPVRLMRLWTRNAADYWRKRSAQAAWSGQGLLLRTEPNLRPPEGVAEAQVFDLSDLEQGINQETAGRLMEAIRRFLEAPQPGPKPDKNISEEIRRLLDEINDPATEPPRRLEIGDRLAELGDTRPGVGVREIPVPVATEVPERGPETEYSPEIRAYLDEINDFETKPPRRLQIGDDLARLGDPRKGVGLDENGLPDLDWVKIPEGHFIYQDGQTLDLRTFYIARYPVTNCQYQTFIDAGGYKEERWWKDLVKQEPEASRWLQTNRPRTNVDWYEPVAFCRWLSAMRGFEIRLPNEQEWEKAARGEKGLVYPWGNEYRSGFANIYETWNNAGPWNLRQTTAVGLYPHGRSPYGVEDLSGNIWEWCLNKYDKPDVTTLDTSGARRVSRGGSWGNDPDVARSDRRSWYDPDYHSYVRGFRVLSSVPIR